MLFGRLPLRLASFVLITCGLCAVSCSSNSSLNTTMPDLSQTDSIQINNGWSGLSPVAPIITHYSLQRYEQGFKGEARFSVAGYSKQPRQASAEIEIPLNPAQSFLKTLATVSLKEGKYEPKIEHTDDYPAISFELKTGTDTVLIFTKSQGEGHVPWGVTFKGKTFVVDSDVPARALKELEPYLKRDVLRKLIEQK